MWKCEGGLVSLSLFALLLPCFFPVYLSNLFVHLTLSSTHFFFPHKKIPIKKHIHHAHPGMLSQHVSISRSTESRSL
ncbi:hypothetical protein FB192DRAFT_1150482 [Mucor lusitanicus]|uniref:Uncharacterized protein n=1 Tax=Mucor circinelloides f. lusitanicus TaxID=29924 RepID=A0A8H4EZA5_MUCCL|nr:hypothetical protein FB192DRAFT_1150482 [Mucor lusitanicus]